MHAHLDVFPSFLRALPQKYRPTKFGAEYDSEKVCIPNPALRAFAAVPERDEGGFEFVASLLVRLQCCRYWVLRAGKYRNMLAHVS